MSGGEKKYVVGRAEIFFKKDCQNVVIVYVFQFSIDYYYLRVFSY